MYLGRAEFQLVSLVRIRRLCCLSINIGGINFFLTASSASSPNVLHRSVDRALEQGGELHRWLTSRIPPRIIFGVTFLTLATCLTLAPWEARIACQWYSGMTARCRRDLPLGTEI